MSKAEQQSAKLVNLADVEPELIDWVWYGVLAAGKVTMLASDPGCGKSTLSVDIASRLSKGLPWPVTGEPAEIGSTILLSAEDDPADTIRPRLDAAGGDPSKVHVLTAVEEHDSQGEVTERGLNLAHDLSKIETAIAGIEDCRLIVVDPISAYMGGVDSHKNAEVRSGILAPLGRVAERHRVAILCITHLNKSNGKAIYRMMGSMAFVAAARLALGVAKDPKDPQRRLLVPIKANIVPDVHGLGYRIVSAPGEVAAGVIEWESKPITESAEELFAMDGDFGGGGDDGADLLASIVEDMLAGGTGMSFADIRDATVDQAGKVGDKTLRKVLRAIGAVSGRDGFQGPTLWRLPDIPPAR